MQQRIRLACACLTLVSLAGCAASGSNEQASIRSQDEKGLGALGYAASASAGQDDHMTLPAGWTEADMQACMMAGMPGEMHKLLAEGAGKWEAKSTMWMAPEMPPMESTGTMKISMIMDGRYARGEMAGEMPGMGPWNGECLAGFDNVSQKFVATWIDSMGSGIMNGTGELSKDGKTITWNYTYNCPIAKKPATMRQIEKITGKDTRTLDMFGKDPKSGKEFQMMHIELTRKSS